MIADDENRSKYATVRSRPEGADSAYDEALTGEEVLDEKTSRRILELGKDQLLEIEMEEQNDVQRRRNKNSSRSGANDDSSDDDDEGDDMDSASITGDFEDEEE